jgi:hypothetical protein
MKNSKCDADLTFFLGKPLEQVCFGSYQIQLNFSEAVSLSVESRLVLTTAQEEVFELGQPYSQAGGLLDLLGKEVISASAESNGDLSLKFSNQSILKVLNENSRYESYQITNGSVSTIV